MAFVGRPSGAFMVGGTAWNARCISELPSMTANVRRVSGISHPLVCELGQVYPIVWMPWDGAQGCCDTHRLHEGIAARCDPLPRYRGTMKRRTFVSVSFGLPRNARARADRYALATAEALKLGAAENRFISVISISHQSKRRRSRTMHPAPPRETGYLLPIQNKRKEKRLKELDRLPVKTTLLQNH